MVSCHYLYSLAIDAAGESSPRLVFQKGTSSDSEYLTKVFAAPIVVVGAIESDTLVRGPIHSDGMLIQLRKLKVRVENVLRGGAVLETTTIYYFTWAGAFNGPRPLGFWGVKGSINPVYRRILWLRKKPVRRSWTACDGWDECTMPAESGTHPNYKPDPRKPLAYALAGKISFTRGNGVTDAEFARQVNGEHQHGAGSLPLRETSATPPTEVPVVRDAACKQLSYYRQKCVDTVGKP